MKREGGGSGIYITLIIFSTAAGRILFAGYDDSSVRAWDVIKVLLTTTTKLSKRHPCSQPHSQFMSGNETDSYI